MDVVFLLASFAVILAGALLFTNAIEWAGHRLGLGEGATGSVLAAVGTAMPETLIPIVALIGGEQGSEDVAVGAIIGAPVPARDDRDGAGRDLGARSSAAGASRARGWRSTSPTLDRDLAFFLVFFAVGIGAGLGLPDGAQVPARHRLRGRLPRLRALDAAWRRRRVQEADEIAPLYMDRSQQDEPTRGAIVLQLAVGLGAIVGGAHLFVEELVTVAADVGIEPLVLSLVLAPLATELPEKANSFFWVRDGKDSLALGNITGAMVFQSTIPIAFGLAFTEWDLDKFAVVSGVLGLVGGRDRLLGPAAARPVRAAPVIAWVVLFGGFIAYVALA